MALLGPSGSGKTTLLRIIAGLEFADSGSVLFDGQDTTHRTARDRRVGFVFQHYALFRHMTVFENIAFGLRVRPRQRAARRKRRFAPRCTSCCKLIQLKNLAGRYPSQLSGGQRQRVALARALAVEPSVLLLDEPFGSLDAKVRLELRRWLRQLHDEVHITSVFVTHDQEEALEVADRVAVMNEGRIEQVGTPGRGLPSSRHALRLQLSRQREPVSRPRSTRKLPPFTMPRPEISSMCVRTCSRFSASPTAASHFRATIKHINSAGPLVKIEAVTEWGAPVQVEMSQEQFRDFSSPRTRRFSSSPKS